MKNFTNSDVRDLDSRFPRINAEPSDLVDAPTEWQKLGLRQTASGYGKRLTVRQKILFEGKLFRLYATCHSNCASVWFRTGGKTIYVH